jgi:hypothetical protein
MKLLSHAIWHSRRAIRADECPLLGTKRTLTSRCLPISIMSTPLSKLVIAQKTLRPVHALDVGSRSGSVKTLTLVSRKMPGLGEKRGARGLARGLGLWRQRLMGLLWADRRPASRGEHDMMKLFLLVAGVFLFPVALSYGVDPAATLPKFMNRRRHAKPHPPLLHGGRAHRGNAWASGAHPRAAQRPSLGDGRFYKEGGRVSSASIRLIVAGVSRVMKGR